MSQVFKPAKDVAGSGGPGTPPDREVPAANTAAPRTAFWHSPLVWIGGAVLLLLAMLALSIQITPGGAGPAAAGLAGSTVAAGTASAGESHASGPATETAAAYYGAIDRAGQATLTAIAGDGAAIAAAGLGQIGTRLAGNSGAVATALAVGPGQTVTPWPAQQTAIARVTVTRLAAETVVAGMAAGIHQARATTVAQDPHAARPPTAVPVVPRTPTAAPAVSRAPGGAGGSGPAQIAGATLPTATARPIAAPPPPTPCSASYKDVPVAAYFFAPVQSLACHSAVSGYADGTFRPYQNTTRAEFTKILVGAENWPINTAGGPHFKDVPPASPFYPFVETAFNRGIISGYADGTFRPSANVTRGQLSRMIVGATGWPLDTGAGPHFRDVPPAQPFYGVIETAYHHAILSGYGDGTFHWGSSATRAQIAKIISLALHLPGSGG